MAYTDEGLGISNIAGPTSVFGNTLARQYLTQRTSSPAPTASPWPTVNRTTTFVPRTTATPVVKPSTPVVRPTISTTAKTPISTFRPVVPAPTPAGGQPFGSAGVMPVLKLPPQSDTDGDGTAVESLASFTKSPLMLAAIGIAALLLLNRR